MAECDAGEGKAERQVPAPGEVRGLPAQSHRLRELAKLGEADGGNVARVEGWWHGLAETLAQKIAGQRIDGLAEEGHGPAMVAALAVRVPPRRARGSAQAHVANFLRERVGLLADGQSLAGIAGEQVSDRHVRQRPGQPPPVAEGAGERGRLAEDIR